MAWCLFRTLSYSWLANLSLFQTLGLLQQHLKWHIDTCSDVVYFLPPPPNLGSFFFFPFLRKLCQPAVAVEVHTRH
jgi:hypothetical protein